MIGRLGPHGDTVNYLDRFFGRLRYVRQSILAAILFLPFASLLYHSNIRRPNRGIEAPVTEQQIIIRVQLDNLEIIKDYFGTSAKQRRRSLITAGLTASFEPYRPKERNADLRNRSSINALGSKLGRSLRVAISSSARCMTPSGVSAGT